jgi:hypothetical protein
MIFRDFQILNFNRSVLKKKNQRNSLCRFYHPCVEPAFSPSLLAATKRHLGADQRTRILKRVTQQTTKQHVQQPKKTKKRVNMRRERTEKT